MKQEKLTRGQKADVMLNNTIWTVNDWIKFCLRENVGLIIEDGKVTGLVTNPTEYRV